MGQYGEINGFQSLGKNMLINDNLKESSVPAKIQNS